MSYTKINITEVEDSAAKHGMGETGESRFPRTALGADATGVAYHALKPGRRQGFAHRHDDAEEICFVLSGAGRVKVEDDVVELGERDLLRLAPKATRQFEAGPDGLTFLVFGPHHERDGELIHDGFWD